MVKKLSSDMLSLQKNQAQSYTSKAKKTGKGFSAQESPCSSSPETMSDDDEYDEVAHSTAEVQGKFPSSEWLLDSCASSHMTDQSCLFRSMTPLTRKKWIKVGGGFLLATHIGNAEMSGRAGRKVVLEDVLLVPKLGVNLVSWNQFSKQFGVQPPSFSLVSPSGETVVQTKLLGGVPFIDEISPLLQERAHYSSCAPPIENAFVTAQSETDLKQWELWHRRFAHFGKNLLQNLHKVTDLKEPIPIPKDGFHQCRVCSIAKMKKYKGKVTERRPERLALVSIDICGPLPISRLGFKYWLEIVDNFSRKKWTFPLRKREDAPVALQNWKIKAERKSSAQLKAKAPRSMVPKPELTTEVGEAMDLSENLAAFHQAFFAAMQSVDSSIPWDSEFLEEVEEMAFAATVEAIAYKQEVPIPKSYKDAVNDKKWGHLWKEAIQKELDALQRANLVTSRWVFDIKRSISGAIEKFKARLVARGFSQKFGVDFMETFAPTVRQDTLRVFMAIVCKKDLHLHQVDVNNAFTESTLYEDIFMLPPPGVELPPNMVFKILKSLYGLKQAARDWNQLCVSKLREIGFTQSEVDPCLLIHKKREIIILIHVDDIPIAAPKLTDVLWFKRELGKIFKIKDLGEPEKILGMRVTRDRKRGILKLDQGHFVRDSLAKMGMNHEKAAPTHSPMDSYEALKPSSHMDERCDKAEYQSINGTWMWPATITRPDIAFALGRMSSFALKKITRYLRSYPDLGL
ncbi:CoA-transferase family III [Stemphylium lycopersici]|uniref:CoA-transferase family III n=1 Tax=Stemphylium lycopersici TaxID=183478 RepID=A0A364MS58_STELY|nr:CoA-transferase family III [Stemphylium lycopersici]